MDREPALAPLHPGPVELEQYLRGRLAPGHAASILAHAVACRSCGATLARSAELLLGDSAPAPGHESLIRART